MTMKGGQNMAILIDMKMPASCGTCPIKSWYPGDGAYVCPFTGVEALYIGRQDACPLIEVKTPRAPMSDEDLEESGFEL